MVQKVILDVDTGTDDAVALMFAALHPEIELVSAVTCHGNVPVKNCTENTLRTFDYIGVDIPVYEGAAKPLSREDYPVPRSQLGASTVHGEYLDIPPSTSKVQSQNGVDYLIEYYMSGAGDDTIYIPVGSMTNIALAVKQAPEIVDHIPEIVIMGGAHAVGNRTPSAESNIWRDPEGAKVLMNAGFKRVVMVPLDATHRALVSMDDCRELREIGTPAALAAAIFTERRIGAYDESQPMDRLQAAPVHDALCTAYIVEPEVLQDVRHLHVDVETTGVETVGRTVMDTRPISGQPPNCYVAFDADEPLFVRLLKETLARTAG